MGRNHVTSSDPFDTVDKPPIPKRLPLIQGHADVADCVGIQFRTEQGPIIRQPLNLVCPQTGIHCTACGVRNESGCPSPFAR